MAAITNKYATQILVVSIVYSIVFTALGEYIAFRVAFDLVLRAYFG
jgi:hypothetical protein